MNFNILDFVSMISNQGAFNQDYIRTFYNGALILDGASPLAPEANYKTHQFVKDFTEIFIRSRDIDTRCLKALIEEALETLSKQIELKNPNKSPSASALITRMNHTKNELELVQVGDCKAYLFNTNNHELPSPVFAKSKIEQLDDIALNSQAAYIEMGFSANQARTLINSLLKNHRGLMNSEQGYASLTLASSCTNLIEYQSILLNSDNTYRLLLATDGFYKGFEDYERNTLMSIMNQSISLEDALNRYRNIESKDYNLEAYPRFKTHDDASAVLIEIHS